MLKLESQKWRHDPFLNTNFLKIPSKVCNVSNARTSLVLPKNNRIDTVAIITLINSVRNAKVSKSQKEIILFSFLSKNKRKSFLDSAPKGQLISEANQSSRGFSQKTHENTSHSSKTEFIRSFFGRILGLTVSFRN